MHKLMDYLNNNTLTPSDSALGEVANSDWWNYVSPEFDNIIWEMFYDRTIFINRKFPVYDTQVTYNNILRTFAITLRTKARQFERLYNVIMKDYEPLWNVDGVTGTIAQDSHTGTDTSAKTGTDTSAQTGTDRTASSGNDSVTHSGRDIDTLSGSDGNSHSITKDDHTKTGSETIAVTGTDINEKAVTTFDSAALSENQFVPTEKDGITHGKTDTHTYNNLKDAHELTESGSTTYGKVDTYQHGHVETTAHGKTDTTTYGKTDQVTHNTLDTITKNLKDEHIDLVIRQGNIGTTKSQDMLLDELGAWSSAMTDFILYVVRTCVNSCTYACEGVE